MTVTNTSVTTSLPGDLDHALERLAAAITRLQDAAGRVTTAERTAAPTAADAAHLAADLDAARSRTARLMGAHQDALARLARVEANVRAVARTMVQPAEPADAGGTG